MARCRFAAVPIDDLERLAVWCRDHTPPSARFVGPPGPKTFRLWSLRSLAFNRAASPYHAEGLADWSARFRDHVGFDGASSDFVRAYQEDRHGLERRYDAMSDAERAALAIRQWGHARPGPPPSDPTNGPLELLHVEGRYAVYRLRPPEQVTRGDVGRHAAGLVRAGSKPALTHRASPRIIDRQWSATASASPASAGTG